MFISPVFAADTNFYSLHDRWNHQQLENKVDKEKAVDDGFASALLSKSSSTFGPGVSAPVLRRVLQEIMASEAFVEMDMDQTLIIENIGGLLKFVSTDPGIVTMENINTETIKMTATAIGTTFIHIWNANGRNTFSVRVLLPRLSPSLYQIKTTQALEKTRSFHFAYDNGRSASYNGEKYRNMTRSSQSFVQNFGLSGDSPYGELEGKLQTQKSRGKTLLSGASVTLKDGKVGPLKNFDAIAGDSQVKPDLIVFPVGRIRGAQVHHWDEARRVNWTGFYGRENQFLFGDIMPGLLSKRTLNSYLSGGVMDFKVNEDARLKAGYFQGSGQSRPDFLNRRGMGVKSEIKLGEHSVLNTETGFDNEHAAQRHSVTSTFDKVRVRNEFRDISKKFYTLVGNPSNQGEVGYLANMTFQPNDRWSYAGSLDIFRDRIIPNPDDPGRYNVHSDFTANWILCEDVNMAFTFQDTDDTGRLGPLRQRTYGLQYNEIVDFWGKKATFFTRFQHRANHFLTNTLNDYRNNQTTVGMYAPLFWGINFSVQKEWNALEEIEISRYTHPNAVTYSWDTSQQLGKTPFYFDARLRIRDEEQTESTSSFMLGEDSTEVSGGLYYREYDNMEIFLTGSFTQYVAESLNVAEPRVEADFYTGMRYDLDTGFHWQPVGSFEGYVYKDQNGDGERQPYEPGLPDMRVYVDGKEDMTDEKGFYELKSVSGKKVTLKLDSAHLPEGFVPTNALEQTMQIIQNKTRQVNFGVAPRSELTGLIYNDLNEDGRFDSQDMGMGSIKVSLASGSATRSNSKGQYTFTNVSAGEQTIALDIGSLPEGYLPVEVPKKSFTLHEGVRHEMSFPLKAKRTLSGRIYADLNGNQKMDAGETPVSGVRVRLDGQTVSSDRAGWYLFDHLKPGSYQITLDSSTLPSSFQLPSPVSLEMPKGPLTRSDRHIGLQKGYRERPEETVARRYDL